MSVCLPCVIPFTPSTGGLGSVGSSIFPLCMHLRRLHLCLEALEVAQDHLEDPDHPALRHLLEKWTQSEDSVDKVMTLQAPDALT